MNVLNMYYWNLQQPPQGAYQMHPQNVPIPWWQPPQGALPQYSGQVDLRQVPHPPNMYTPYPLASQGLLQPQRMPQTIPEPTLQTSAPTPLAVQGNPQSNMPGLYPPAVPCYHGQQYPQMPADSFWRQSDPQPQQPSLLQSASLQPSFQQLHGQNQAMQVPFSIPGHMATLEGDEQYMQQSKSKTQVQPPETALSSNSIPLVCVVCLLFQY